MKVDSKPNIASELKTVYADENIKEKVKDAAGAMVRATITEDYKAPEHHHRMTQEFTDFARVIDEKDYETAQEFLDETVALVKVLETARKKAAGMMAAYQAAKCGNDVSLYEKNEKLGKKIFITGKGRCNVTNACEIEELLDHVVTNKEFLYSGFYSFTNDAMMELLEELGCPLKVERGNRVFPVSDHSSDVIAALQRGLRKENVDIYFNTTVKKILIEDGIATGVRLASGDTVKADKVVVATGGMSYQATG